jgi:hypothetical protein
MTTIINANTSSGLVYTADTSGIVKVQSNGVTTNALAWVNFNGTLSTPITPRANYNVSSVTKVGTGSYTLNFITALADANYAAIGSVGPASAGGEALQVSTFTTTNVAVFTSTQTSGLLDRANVCVAIFGN